MVLLELILEKTKSNQQKTSQEKYILQIDLNNLVNKDFELKSEFINNSLVLNFKIDEEH